MEESAVTTGVSRIVIANTDEMIAAIVVALQMRCA